MTEKRYSFNWERGHPNFWDNHCNLADSYLTCEDVVDKLNELNELAEANEEQGLKIMTYLHDKYYDIWEEVNEVFR